MPYLSKSHFVKDGSGFSRFAQNCKVKYERDSRTNAKYITKGHTTTPGTPFPKLSEDYVVDTCVKPAVLERIDPQKFGAVPKSSTTHALISMSHFWRKWGFYMTRTVWLSQSLWFNWSPCSSPKALFVSIICWILNFLTNRRQRVKLSCDFVSEWRSVPAAGPQGTKLSPWLFLIMMDWLARIRTPLSM